VPAVGSRIGGIPEGIIDGQTGFLAPQCDADALAAKIADLLNDRELRLRMGAAARTLIEQRFDMGRQTETLEGLYDEVLARGR
jgi:glycosyltransferase involved in cell wall biosynthesis